MTAFTIIVDDAAVQAVLHKLASRAGGLRPVLQAVGEGMVERTKRRFETGTGPDGNKWKENSPATLAMLAGRLRGQKSKVNKGGALNKAGRTELAGKKPLIEGGDLRRQITSVATGESLTVGATMVYAAMQQFGGTLGPRTWFPGAKIPARPFLPVYADGTLYPKECDAVLAELNDYLMGGL